MPSSAESVVVPPGVPRLARLCAGAACAIGALVLIGWAADIAALRTIAPGLVSMKPNAAVCFMLCGMGLLCAIAASGRRTSILFGLAAAAVGGATLAQYVGGWDFGIDELLFAEPSGAYASLSKSRMHPTTAFSFLCSGLGIALLDVRVWRRLWPGQLIATATLALGFGTLLCYAFGVREFIGISRFGQMAVHTAVGFILLSLAMLLARPRIGYMPAVISLRHGAALARTMLLAAVAIPFTVGLSILLSIRAGLFGNEFGLAVQIVVTSACFSVFVLLIAKTLAAANRARARMEEDLQRAHQELELRVAERTAELATANQRLQSEIHERHQIVEALRRSEEKIRSMVDSANAAIVTADQRGAILSWNKGATAIFGYDEREVLGLPLSILIPPALRPLHQAGLERYVRTGQAKLVGSTVEVQGVRKDGSEVPIELSLAAWKSGGEDFFSGIIIDISKRKQAEAELVAAKDMAEAGSRAKGDFLATMSHEIRTPMNGIIGMLGFVLDSPLAEEQRGFAETARSSAEALLVIINDILDFSKIEAGKLDVERVPFDIQTAVEEVVDLLADRVEAKGIEIVIPIPPGIPTRIVGDPGRVRQVLLNLIGNAVKFTDRGVIEIGLAEEDAGSRLRITVRDTGIGIAADRQAALFEKFTQADVSTTRRYGGTGLGLAISRRLVELMGGSVGFTSVPGEGSTFWFELPVAPSAGSAPPAQPVLQRVAWVDGTGSTRDWASVWLTQRGIIHAVHGSVADLVDSCDGGPDPDVAFIEAGLASFDDLVALRRTQPLTMRIALICRMPQRALFRDWRNLGFCALLPRPIRPSLVASIIAGGSRSDVPSSPLLPGALHQRGRALLAEDNVVNQRVASRLLERLGLRVDIAANGIDAIGLAMRLPYDVVFMDCQMPEMDGFAATTALRKLQGHRRTPIIALTANALSDDRQRCLDAGMDDYLSKPVRFEELKAMVDRWLPSGGTPVQPPS